MKKTVRIFCALLAFCMMLSMAGCSETATYAIKVGDLTVSENDYARAMKGLKQNYLTAENAQDTADFWKEQAGDGGTRADELTEHVNDALIELKLYALQFDRLGLSLTEGEEQGIITGISEVIAAEGGMDAFNSLLAELDYTYEEYVTEVYDRTKKTRVLLHYFGEDGEEPVAIQDLKDYYNLHNTLVKMIFISKVVEGEGIALEGEELAAAKQKAEDALAAAQAPSDTDLFDELISLYSGDTSTKGDPLVFPDTLASQYAMVDVALKMEIGEVKLIEQEGAFVILKRYDGGAEEYFTNDVYQATLETVRAKEISKMLESWREDANIKINKSLIKKYRPENTVQ